MDKRKLPMTEEHKRKIGDAQRGIKKKPQSKETILKRLKTFKEIGYTPKPPNLKGYKQSKEHIEKRSKARKGKPNFKMRGENNPLWRGGVSKDINNYMINYRKNKKEKLAGRRMPDNCEICGMPTKDLKRGLCFDHNHETGEFRGWICTRCNTAIGLVDEKKETLLSIIKYLEEKSIKSVKGLN